jgi:hypothetical protein
MPQFQIGAPVETEQPTVEVTVDANSPLPTGQHTFQLVVVDDSGNQSTPATVQVVVRDLTAPTAVIKAPTQVPFGQSFSLDGSASSDPPPGRVVKFVWTMVS